MSRDYQFPQTNELRNNVFLFCIHSKYDKSQVIAALIAKEHTPTAWKKNNEPKTTNQRSKNTFMNKNTEEQHFIIFLEAKRFFPVKHQPYNSQH